MSIAEIQNEVVADLTVELSGEAGFNPAILTVKVKNAIREVMTKRNYGATSFNERQIANDLNRFYAVIVNVARYDYNQIGSEGETAHSENGTSRTYEKRNRLFADVFPFVGCL